MHKSKSFPTFDSSKQTNTKTTDMRTELENRMIEAIKETWGMTGAANTYLEDVVEEMGISTKIARGVISSLIKKGIVIECLPQYGGEINLTEKGIEELGVEFW